MTQQRFFQLANNRLAMWFYMLLRLPMAWFSGMSVSSCTPQKTVVKLPFSWRAQNPFRSTYFAAQCAAGEMSTGLMALGQLQERAPMSMLVTNMEAAFFKKASETLLFTCEDGNAIAAAIQKAYDTGEAQTLVATSTARLPDGSVASTFQVTWSFKAKSGY